MEQERINAVLRRVAEEDGVTVDEVMEEIRKIIDFGVHSQDPQVRKQWDAIPRQGDKPTVAELMSYLFAEVQKHSTARNG